jgi:glutathione S-transferase
MSKLSIHSFADVDRSGKVRWTACELDYDIEEVIVKLGEHRGQDYLKLNPYAQIPTVEIEDETWVESSAICIMLAEKHPESGLIPSDPKQRLVFWQVIMIASSTLETPTVNYFLASRGIIDERWVELAAEGLNARLEAFAASLPSEAYLCDTFSIADICAAYVLRLAVQAKLLPLDGRLADYLGRLRARPAAIKSRFFDSLEF